MLIETSQSIASLDWDKGDGLLPAIVQDAFDGRVLMQAWMTAEALELTLESGKVTFWSRSRKKIWTKGETSGNTLQCQAVHADCDKDCLLVLAKPLGPTCHRNTPTCFDGDELVAPELTFLASLERLLEERKQSRPEGSYTTRLFDAGIKRISQKVGEEGVETALAATSGDLDELRNESADLIYHLLVLLRATNLSLNDVLQVLKQRHKA